MQATAAIGAAFGDEGKGQTVAALSNSKTLVIRSNGGAQAGHTVVSDHHSGLRVKHVFKHIGSGTLNRADTYLSKYFLTNPFIWQDEFLELAKFQLYPIVYVNPSSRVSTPYDMLINQEAEYSRTMKHGSCGYGINETVERSVSHPIVASDLKDIEKLRRLLRAIRSEWVPARLKRLGLEPRDEFISLLDNPGIMDHYLKCSTNFASTNRFLDDDKIKNWDKVVFEGAQGLLLDEENTEFAPHLTRSRCGLPNILRICENADIKDLKVVYITRAYTTRHGAGPFPTERPDLSYPDETNQPNPHQGTLRFGLLNVDLLMSAIRKDLSNVNGSVKVSHELAMTCLNQVADKVEYFQSGVKIAPRKELPGLVAAAVGAEPWRYPYSYQPHDQEERLHHDQEEKV